jgi:pyruvate ferredoxin oxidoreductase delta subunit
MSKKGKEGWRKIPRGATIMCPGNAEAVETGTWRTYRPIHSDDKCIQCLQCWIMCPDDAIIVENEKVVGVDLYHCKGCGICAVQCPAKPKALEMKLESEFAGEDE